MSMTPIITTCPVVQSFITLQIEITTLDMYGLEICSQHDSGIAVYDAMNYIKSEVTTICVGTAASMASFILAGGDRGKRIALPHSRIMIHQPEGGSQGQASEVLSESEEVMRIRRQVGRIYSERTGQPLSRISRDMDRDQFLSAREAKDYGLVDQVAVDTKWSTN